MKKNENVTALLSCLGALALVPTIIVVGVLVNTAITALLWTWFVTPTLGLERPSFWLLAGLLAMVSWLRRKSSAEVRDLAVRPMDYVNDWVTIPVLTILTGYVLHVLAR